MLIGINISRYTIEKLILHNNILYFLYDKNKLNKNYKSNKKVFRFSNEYKKNYILINEQEKALIGIMLGDGYLYR